MMPGKIRCPAPVCAGSCQRSDLFLAVEQQQLPLNGQNGASDTMLRASASFPLMAANTATNGTRTVQAGLPKTCTSMRQYVRQDIQAWTADYRVSWHQEGGGTGRLLLSLTPTPGQRYRDKGTPGRVAWRCRGPLEYLDRARVP
ncbi:hypothetical protein MJ581_03210 [Escherichia coli]|nr:hypothetical protein MJ581_03210 [Escherichia coli]